MSAVLLNAEHLKYINLIIIGIFTVAIIVVLARYKVSCADALKDLRNRMFSINEKIAVVVNNDPVYDSSLNRQIADEAFKEDESLNLLWKLFEKTLITRRIHTTTEDKKVYHSTVVADDYINFASVTDSININFWQNIGGIFTGIGIFGTFVGLTLGLLYVGIHDIDKETMQVLMQGLGTAFFTSLLGVFAALLFNYFHKKYTENLKFEIDRTDRYIELMFNRMTAEQLLAYSFEKAEEQAEQFQSFSSTLAVSIGNAFEEKLSQSDFAENVQNIDKHSIRITSFLENELSNVIDKAIDARLEPVFRDLQIAIDKLASSGLDAVAEGIQNSAGKELGEFAHTLQSLSENISASLAEMKATSGSVKSDLNESITNVISALDKSIQKVVEQTKAQQDNLKDVSDSISRKLEENINAIITAMAAQAATIKDQTDAHQQSLIETGNTVSAAVIESIEKIKKQVEDITKEYVDKNKATNMEISELLNKLIKCIEEQQDTLTKINSSANNLINNASKAADKFGEAAGPIENASTNLSTSLGKTMEATSAFNTSVTESVKTLKNVADSNISGIKDISKEFDRTRQDMQSTANEYRDASKQLETILKTIDTSLKQYNAQVQETYKKTLQTYAKEIGNACGSLATITEELTDAINEMNNSRR